MLAFPRMRVALAITSPNFAGGEHRWQKFKMMFVNQRCQQLTRGLWPSPAEILATVSGVVTIVGVVVAIVRWIAMATSVA
jgi:hypothetical protein